MKRNFTIGRSRECDIVLPDNSVSRVHAELRLLEDGKLFLTDRESMNGTALLESGTPKPIRQEFVAPADTIRFGSYDISVRELLDDIHRKFPAAGAGGGGGGGDQPSPPKAGAGAGGNAADDASDKPWVQGQRLVRCRHCGAVAKPGVVCEECGSSN